MDLNKPKCSTEKRYVLNSHFEILKEWGEAIFQELKAWLQIFQNYSNFRNPIQERWIEGNVCIDKQQNTTKKGP